MFEIVIFSVVPRSLLVKITQSFLHWNMGPDFGCPEIFQKLKHSTDARFNSGNSSDQNERWIFGLVLGRKDSAYIMEDKISL